MITHIVFFKLIDRSPDSINRARDVLMGLAGKVPQLRHLEVGVDVGRTARSYDLALITKFESMADLEAYRVHPAHVEVADYIASVRSDSAAVDYETA